MRRSAIAIALAALVAAPSSFAQSPPSPPATPPGAKSPYADSKEAEERFQRGRQLFEEGDYALALVEFNRAYDLSPNYRVLFNIAQINIQLFNYAAARTALEKFLRDGGDDIPATRKAQAERDLQMLRGRTAHLTINVVPPADVTLDDAPIGTTPFTAPILVNAGQRKIIVSRLGYVSVTKIVTVAGGDTQDVNVELVPVPTEERPEGPKVSTTMKKNYTPATIGWVTTGVLALGAGVFGGIYLSKESELEGSNDPKTPVTSATRDSDVGSATRMAVVADVFGVLAIGAAAVSLYFTLKPPQYEAVTVGKIRVTPTGLAGTF